MLAAESVGGPTIGRAVTHRRAGDGPRPKPWFSQVWRVLQTVRIGVPARHRLVLLALAEYADPDGGNCFPAIAELCDGTGLSRAPMCRALRELEAAGWIVRTRRTRPDRGGQTSTLYTVRLGGGPITAIPYGKTRRGLAPKPLPADVLSARGVTSIGVHRARVANGAPDK